MIKFGKFHLVFLIAIVIAIAYMLSNGNYKKPNTTKDIVSFCNVNKNRILSFEDSLVRIGLSDSNFYAENRFRENKFYFFRLEGDELGENFNIDLQKYNAFEHAAAQLNIKNVWKYPDENFYTLAIRGMEKFDDKKLFILVLKNNERQFLPPSNSSINIQDTTSSLQDFDNGKSVFIVNSKIWIKLK